MDDLLQCDIDEFNKQQKTEKITYKINTVYQGSGSFSELCRQIEGNGERLSLLNDEQGMLTRYMGIDQKGDSQLTCDQKIFFNSSGQTSNETQSSFINLIEGAPVIRSFNDQSYCSRINKPTFNCSGTTQIKSFKDDFTPKIGTGIILITTQFLNCRLQDLWKEY